MGIAEIYSYPNKLLLQTLKFQSKESIYLIMKHEWKSTHMFNLNFCITIMGVVIYVWVDDNVLKLGEPDAKGEGDADPLVTVERESKLLSRWLCNTG